MQIHMGFEPLFDKNSRTLILGSFPSVISREVNFYYGNKRNRFWQVMQQAFGGDVSDVQAKQNLCLANGIALWDVVQSCQIKGSQDAKIANCTLVDLSALLQATKVTKILCNGAKAYELTLQAYHGNLPVIKLPSTSPANPRFDIRPWLEQLQR